MIPLQGEAEMVLQVQDLGGGRGVELHILGAVGARHRGVVDPAPFADTLELYVSRVGAAFLDAFSLAQASAA
jgi:hypothetical protein